MSNVIFEWAETDASKSSADTVLINFFWLEFSKTIIFDKKEILSFNQTKLTSHCDSLHKMVIILCRADSFCEYITNPFITNT